MDLTRPPSPPAAGAAPGRAHFLRPVEADSYSSREICAIRHDFHHHPLMQMPALARLAKDLWPKRQCRFIRPGSTQSAPFDHAPADPHGRDIDEVFRRIEEPGSWVALYNVEAHPDYRAFLAEVAECFRPLVEGEQGRILEVGGFIFISAPPSVTPFHIDRENNFWLQIRGRKTLNVWDRDDRRAVAAGDVDRFIVHADLGNVRLKDGDVERSREFDVGPGDGVYFPSTSPHMTRTVPGWARPGDGVSVSIGIVFYTEETRRAAHVHACNLMLRRFGASPSLPGRSAAADRLKSAVGRAVVWAKRRFRGYQPRAGF